MYYDFNLTVYRQHLTELEGIHGQTSNPRTSANWSKERELEAVRAHTSPADLNHSNKSAWTGLFATFFGVKRAQL